MRILCNIVITVLSNVVQCRKCRRQKVFENVICLTRVSTAFIANSFPTIVFTINNGMTVIAKKVSLLLGLPTKLCWRYSYNTQKAANIHVSAYYIEECNALLACREECSVHCGCCSVAESRPPRC